MIRRGDEIRVGPIRIPVMANNDGRCSIIPFYGEVSALGQHCFVDEGVLERLAAEDGVTVRYASQKSAK